MSNNISTTELIGHFPGNRLPWINDPSLIAIHRLITPNTTPIFIASAANPAMNLINERVRKAEGSNYTKKYDQLFVKGCRLVATRALMGTLVQPIRDRASEFSRFDLIGFREAASPNAARIYCARTKLGQLGPLSLRSALSKADTELPIVLRLVSTNKQKHNQTAALQLLTARSAAQISNDCRR